MLPWRVYLALGGVIAALLLVLYVRHLQGEVREALAEAAAQARQAQLNDAGIKSVDRYVHETKIIREKAEEAQNEVRQAPGASDEFAVRDELCRALERLRDGEPVCVDPGPPGVP